MPGSGMAQTSKIMKKRIIHFTRRLAKHEMKKVKGGWGWGMERTCFTSGPCSFYEANTGMVTGSCQKNSAGNCVCRAANSSIVSDECVAYYYINDPTVPVSFGNTPFAPNW
jgi:hypothetical protein